MSDLPIRRCEFHEGQMALRIDRTIRARVEEIDPLVEEILVIVGRMGCAAGREYEVETALREAIANAVIHGARRHPGKEVQVSVACEEARGMLIVVRDPGPGFDPAQVPSPIQGENLFSSHGRGIFLINQLMDEVRFERGGTEIHMRLAPSGPAAG